MKYVRKFIYNHKISRTFTAVPVHLLKHRFSVRPLSLSNQLAINKIYKQRCCNVQSSPGKLQFHSLIYLFYHSIRVGLSLKYQNRCIKLLGEGQGVKRDYTTAKRWKHASSERNLWIDTFHHGGDCAPLLSISIRPWFLDFNFFM